jgi:hypothetical protein
MNQLERRRGGRSEADTCPNEEETYSASLTEEHWFMVVRSRSGGTAPLCTEEVLMSGVREGP